MATNSWSSIHDSGWSSSTNCTAASSGAITCVTFAAGAKDSKVTESRKADAVAVADACFRSIKAVAARLLGFAAVD